MEKFSVANMTVEQRADALAKAQAARAEKTRIWKGYADKLRGVS